MEKKRAKIFVNSITMTRVIGTLVMPFVSINMSPTGIIIYIMALLFTDTLDGIFARKLNACTIFGALLDVLADKLLGIATLGVLAYYYPVMLLPMITEIVITLINVMGATKGSSMESSTLGKIKTWVLGLTIVSGFCTIYAEDIISLFNNASRIGDFFIDTFRYIILHKNIIMNSLAFVSVGAGIMVSADYRLRVKSEVKNAEKVGLKAKEIKLKRGKDLKFALFDSDYYIKTKNQPLLQRLGEKENKDEKVN